MFDKKGAYDALTSQKLTHEQKLMTLAKYSENAMDVLDISDRMQFYFDNGSINDLFE